MSNDTANIRKEPIYQAFQSINFSDLQKFNGEYFCLDEIVFMQYLIYHCSKYGCWSQSMTQIVSRLKIKPKRLESIKAKFARAGWIRIQTGEPCTIGKYKVLKNATVYEVDFDIICQVKFLRTYYDIELIKEEDTARNAENKKANRTVAEIDRFADICSLFACYLADHRARKLEEQKYFPTTSIEYEPADLPFP